MQQWFTAGKGERQRSHLVQLLEDVEELFLAQALAFELMRDVAMDAAFIAEVVNLNLARVNTRCFAMSLCKKLGGVFGARRRLPIFQENIC